MKANLCKCNNCDAVMVDQNPQIGATEHNLTGREIEMQYFQLLVENNDRDLFWGCPNCETDGYLVDL